MDERTVECTFWTSLIVVVATILLLGLGAITKSVLMSGEVSYCYTNHVFLNQMNPVYQLWGFREWREDRLIGTYTSVDEALKVAGQYGCRMGTRGAEK